MITIQKSTRWTIVFVVGKYFNISRRYIYTADVLIYMQYTYRLIRLELPQHVIIITIYINKISVKLPYFIKRKYFLTILILDENSAVYYLDCEKTLCFLNFRKDLELRKPLYFTACPNTNMYILREYTIHS